MRTKQHVLLLKCCHKNSISLGLSGCMHSAHVEKFEATTMNVNSKLRDYSKTSSNVHSKDT